MSTRRPNLRLSELLGATERRRDRDLERISNVLHDETGALLTGVGLKLELLRMDGVEGLDPVIQALEKAFDSVRRLSRNVHPKLVERVGLSKALEALVQSARGRFQGELLVDLADNVDGPAEMYGIAEELLDNAIRHSQAGTISLSLTSTGELIVRDNGVGLAHMRERAGATTGVGLLRVGYLGGRAHLRVRIRTAPELGTIIQVTQQTPCHSTSY